jgi:hypothetical protein
MSDTVAAPSDTAVDTVTADAPDDPTVAEAQEFAAEQVAADEDPKVTSAIDATREWRRRARALEGDITGYDGISQLTPGQLPSNSAGLIGRDPEKVAARENERTVPPFLTPEDAVLWVGGDPGRAQAVELSQEAKDDPDEELLEAVRATVGTDGADVRADRDRAEGRDESNVPESALSDGATKTELRDAAAARAPLTGSAVEPQPGPQPPGVPQMVKSQQDRLIEAGGDAPLSATAPQADTEEAIREARLEQFADWSEPESLAEEKPEGDPFLHAADEKPGGRDVDPEQTSLGEAQSAMDEARTRLDTQLEERQAEVDATAEARGIAAEANTGVTGTDAADAGDEAPPTGITGDTPPQGDEPAPEDEGGEPEAADDEWTREELEQQGVEDLRTLAGELDPPIVGRSRMNKGELVDAIYNHA